MRSYASLRRAAEFSRLRRYGRRVPTHALTLYLGEARPADRRSVVGISVSTAVGNAVIRNLVRRRIGAILHSELLDKPPVRLLVVAQPAAAQTAFATLQHQLRGALER